MSTFTFTLLLTIALLALGLVLARLTYEAALWLAMGLYCHVVRKWRARQCLKR